MTSNLLCLNNQSINQSINHTINQSFIKYIRLTKRSPIYKRVLRLVEILIQLPSNNVSIVFWRKGQVVRSRLQVKSIGSNGRPFLTEEPSTEMYDLQKKEGRKVPPRSRGGTLLNSR